MRSFVAALLGARLHLQLSAARLAILESPPGRAAPRRLAELPLAPGVAGDAARLAEACAPALGEGRVVGFVGLPLWVTLGDELVRLFMVTPPANATGPRDLRIAAAMRFQQLYGESEAGWHVRGDADARHPFLACAIARPQMLALTQLARTFGTPLASVVPRFVDVWNRGARRRTDAWLGVVQAGVLTLGAVSPGDAARLRGVHRLALPAPGADPRWLHDQVQRVALREEMPPPRRLQVAGPCPADWLRPGACPGLDVLAIEVEASLLAQRPRESFAARGGEAAP